MHQIRPDLSFRHCNVVSLSPPPRPGENFRHSVFRAHSIHQPEGLRARLTTTEAAG